MTKDRARFAIGIDLGTTNSALAFAPLVGEGTPEVLLVPQWEGLASLTEKPTLPSFLYLPEEAVAAHLRGEEVGAGQWIVGLFARMKASEAPGRVVHSAKSWLCHHAADRSAPFLPWGSTVLAREQKISPVRASALILNYLRGIWNSRFAQAGFAFDDQDITVTVPASFDAAAQRLTITAAEEAGFPGDVRLLEEPQAAFYCWLESHDPARELWQRTDIGDVGLRHVLVIDIGGGTSDFSIFEVRLNEQTPEPDIRRVAVSDHTLLGGDNIDLAMAHFLEPRLAGAAGQLSGPQWDQLVAACRHLKERALAATGPPDERFVVALAGRGSGMVGGSQTATVMRAEIESLLLDGFFPFCDAAARPYRTHAALREWGLPYPPDSAITRHLADFLNDRPRVDAVLFNGGSVRPPLLRQRLREQIGGWQDGFVPQVLENEEPDLAVARGAARFGALLHHRSGRIAAGAAAAIFLEVEGIQATDRQTVRPPLVCVLPQGAAPSQLFEIADLGLKLRTDQLVRFQAYSSTRKSVSRAGDIVSWSEGEFHPLPPLQTIVRTAELSGPEAGGMLPVGLTARMNALGLLHISCVSADPAVQQSWPLEFNMREHVQGVAGAPGAGRAREANAPIEPNASADALETARRQIGIVFTQPANNSKKNKITAATILKGVERILALCQKRMERAPAARPLACARGAAGRQTTFGGPRRGMAHHGWIPAAPGLRRCPGRPSYRCPVAGARWRPVFSRSAHQEPGIHPLAPGGGRAHARTPDQAYGRRDRQDPQRQGARRTRAPGWIPGTDPPRHQGGTGALLLRHRGDACTGQAALRSLSCGARAPAQPNSALRRAGDCRLARSRRARVSGFPALRLDYAGVARPAEFCSSGPRASSTIGGWTYPCLCAA